ncbi:PRC-barrel domain-containing protein [Bosea sp. BK604]|uniref:PRC-barrel domain-containing protein n=1 Tax=Bosea sp. BK604 TaxID=2512180 RepID=UPI00104BB80D|nr:PRC-barrel domain-containing protein [Bosea sp. BK604]TCR65461.1 PRC-barrel domain protein [Bosea sp. BK604]
MRTYRLFQAANSPDLRGFTDEPTGARLPVDLGPWTLVQEIQPDGTWTPAISRAVVAAGIIENGFYLWGPVERAASHLIIASDRVEGTAVYDRKFEQIGTIKRLLIEKVSGRVLFVDVIFGGFLGIGSHHVTIPWDKLAYDKEIEGYRTDITEAQVRGAAALYGDKGALPDPKHQQDMSDYWNDAPE